MCDECSYSSGNVHNLKVHKDKKHNSTDFYCKLCDDMDTKLSFNKFKSHIEDEHMVNKYSCNMCNFENSDFLEFKIHKYTDHRVRMYNYEGQEPPLENGNGDNESPDSIKEEFMEIEIKFEDVRDTKKEISSDDFAQGTFSVLFLYYFLFFYLKNKKNLLSVIQF